MRLLLHLPLLCMHDTAHMHWQRAHHGLTCMAAATPRASSLVLWRLVRACCGGNYSIMSQEGVDRGFEGHSSRLALFFCYDMVRLTLGGVLSCNQDVDPLVTPS